MAPSTVTRVAAACAAGATLAALLPVSIAGTPLGSTSSTESAYASTVSAPAPRLSAPQVRLATAPLAQTSEAKLLAGDASPADFFGNAVAAFGNWVVVGAPTAGSSGAAYVFVKSGSAWTQAAKLTGAGASGNANFGFSVAMHGNTVLVGAPADSRSGLVGSGAAYVFERQPAGFAQTAVLTPSDPVAGGQLGISVALHGGSGAVGANGDDDNGPFSGSVYLFKRGGGSWQPAGKVNPSDGATGDQFGRSVSLHDRTLLTGAWRDGGVGSAYVYVRQGQGWTETAKLVAGKPAAGFGWSVAVHGSTSVIGSPFSDAAFTFEHKPAGWQASGDLVGSDSAPGDNFGRSVSIHGGTVLVGAPMASSGPTHGGAAYAFRRSSGQWTEHQKLAASDADTGDGYGISVSLAGSRALIGAWAEGDGGPMAGAAYVEAVP